MLRRKNLVVVGLTTFNTEMLKISVSALAHIKSKFALIIHNDNPGQTITTRDIRKLGYMGPVHIINSHENVGLRMARLRILDMADNVDPDAKWIIYMCDDDILLSTDIPTVGANIFAVIQNSLVVRRRVSDLIIGAEHPERITADGDNIVLERPHIGINGTALRMDIMQGMANLMHSVQIQLDEIDAGLGFRAPVDEMMWMALNTYTRRINPELAPIYMDCVNYIRNGIDTTATKYGRPANNGRNAARALARAMAQYDAVIARAMAEC